MLECAICRSPPHHSDVRTALYRLSDICGCTGRPSITAAADSWDSTPALTEPTWRRICRETTTRPDGMAAVRTFLINDLQGLFTFHCRTSESQYALCTAFPLRLNPELNAALIGHAEQFTPTTKSSNELRSMDLITSRGLHLPANDARVDVDEMHRLVNLWRHGNLHRRHAQTAGVSPMPFDWPARRTPRQTRRPYRRNGNEAPACLREGIAPLYHLIGCDGSTKSKARASVASAPQSAFHAQTVVQLAHDYGIAITPHGGARTTSTHSGCDSGAEATFTGWDRRRMRCQCGLHRECRSPLTQIPMGDQSARCRRSPAQTPTFRDGWCRP